MSSGRRRKASAKKASTNKAAADTAFASAGVGITREALATFLEDTLRTQVLHPLFRAMPFEHVEYHHGGPLERGADFLLLQRDILSTRLIAVVVKAGPLNGSVGARNGPGEVRTQIEQALGTAFRHPVTMQPTVASECWVVTGGAIDKNARESMAPLLGQRFPMVRWVDGDQILAWLKEYRQLPAALAHIEEAREILQHVAPGGTTVSAAALAGGAVFVGVHPQTGANPDPIPFKVTLQQPPGDDGERRLREAMRAMLFGGKISSADGVLASYEPPAIMASLMTAGEDLREFALESIPKVPSRVLEIRALDTEHNELARWTSILANIIVPVPGSWAIHTHAEGELLAFEISHHGGNEHIKLGLRREGDGPHAVDAVRALESIQFLIAAGGASCLEVGDARSGVPIVIVPLSPQERPAAPHDILQFYELAAWLQRHLRITIPVSTGEIASDYASSIGFLGLLLREGSFSDTVEEAVLRGEINSEAAAAFLGANGPNPFATKHEVAFPVDLPPWRVTVPTAITVVNGRWCDVTKQALEAIAASGSTQTVPCTLRLVPRDGRMTRVIEPCGPVTIHHDSRATNSVVPDGGFDADAAETS
jgi:hypothetical protein